MTFEIDKSPTDLLVFSPQKTLAILDLQALRLKDVEHASDVFEGHL